MRNLLVLLLIGGIAYLGYEFGRRRNGEVDAKTKNERIDEASKKRAAQSGQKRETIGTLELDKTGIGDIKAPVVVPDTDVEFADTSTAEAAARYSDALEKNAWDGVKADAELRESFPLGTTARYALEVALERAASRDSVDPDQSAKLHEAARALLLARNGKDQRSRLVDGFSSLVQRGFLGRAVAAVAFRNEFLSGTGGLAAARKWIGASAALEPVARVLALSALLDALTRGQVAVWKDGEGYALLKDAYMPLQAGLKRVLFNSSGTWKSRHVRVKRGQSLVGIASSAIRNWKIPMSPGLLQLINGIPSPKSLRAGQKLRVPTERMHVVVEKSTFSMKVYLGNVLVRLYEVGLGENDSTPETVFTVTERQLDLPWTNPRTGETFAARHPKNLVGRHFIKIEDGGTNERYGIHGTKDQSSIGKNSSMGCIRLRQNDIEDVFSYIPTDTKVAIRR